MNITVRDITDLTIMKDIHLVAGEKGLDHIASWIYFAEHYKVRPWLNGGEIVIYSTIKENLKEESIQKLLDVSKEADVAAVMIYVNDDFKKIPEDICELADKLGIPLFEVPWEIKVVQLTKEISNYIIRSNSIDDFSGDMFRKILLGEEMEEYIDELTGLSVFGNISDFVIATVMIPKTLKTDNGLLSSCKNHLQYYLSNEYHAVCVCSINNMIVIYASVSSEQYKKIGDQIEHIIGSFAANRKSFSYKISVSSARYGKKHIVEAFKESIDALNYIANMKNNLIFYTELGIEKIFYEVHDMKRLEDLYQASIGILKEYDKKNDDNLHETLMAYLDNNCDVVTAADVLFIHKNSMRYRLKKIEGITGKHFTDMQELTDFYNARKIGIFLKKEKQEV